MSNEVRVPRIGVGVIIQRHGRILLGKRLGAHGTGTWALPGGHLEFGERIEDCAAREVLEETGLLIGDISLGPYSENIFTSVGHHYVTLFAIARCDVGEAQNCEPDKCEGWQWFEWTSMPEPLFAPLQSLLDSGFTPAPAATR